MVQVPLDTFIFSFIAYTDFFSNMIKICVGMFGLCGTLIGLVWGFTQFISRSREMTDLEFANFARESFSIIRYLILSCLIFMSTSLFSATAIIIGELSVYVPYIGLCKISSILLFLLIALFSIGLFILANVFIRIWRSMRYLARRK